MGSGWGTESWGTFAWGGFAVLGGNLEPDSTLYLVDIYSRVSGHLRYSNRDFAVFPTPSWKDQALSTGATAVWMLNEASGTAILDSGLLAQHLTGGGSLVRLQPGPLGSRWDNNFGTDFPGGSGTAASIAAASTVFNPRLNSFSIEAWFQLATVPPPGQTYTFCYRRSAGSTIYTLHMTQLNDLIFRYDNASSVTTQASAGTGAAAFTHDGLWHHIVGVRDVTQAKAFIYLDGVLVGSATEITVSDLNLGAVTFYVGSSDAVSSTCDGALFGVSWYDRALTPGQILMHYLEGIQGPTVRQLPTEYRPE